MSREKTRLFCPGTSDLNGTGKGLKYFWKTDGGKNTSSSKFESGVTSVEDDECSDGPVVSKTIKKCGLYKGTCS